MCDSFSLIKMTIFINIAPIKFSVKKYYASIQFKKHSAAMHFTIVKLPFSARSPPAQILCVDKIRFSAEKLLQDLAGIGSRYRIEV